MAADSAPQALHLLYHEIRPSATQYAYVLTTGEFDQHLAALAPLVDSAAIRPVITFDDGHLSNLEHALPALQRHGLDAIFFITAGWTGKRSGYMRPEHLRALRAAGHTLGAHGLTHALLTHCSPAQLQTELISPKQLLEDILGEPVTTLSLPGGRFNARVLEACYGAGYTSVYTSQPRLEPLSTARQIGRLNIRQGLSTAALLSFFDPAANALSSLARTQQLKERIQGLLGDRLYARLWALLNREEQQDGDLGETTA